jgi:hypothetical protein
MDLGICGFGDLRIKGFRDLNLQNIQNLQNLQIKKKIITKNKMKNFRKILAHLWADVQACLHVKLSFCPKLCKNRAPENLCLLIMFLFSF